MNQTSDLDDLLAEDLADPEGRALYEEIGAMVEFGIALALAREARKMSIKTLATATELPYTTIRDIEKGNIAPTLLMQMKLAHALKARTEIAGSGSV